MRVLLVEDEVVTSRAICLFLKADCGAVVDVADTGEEAIEMARHYDYDAVLLDLMLPDMEGLDALRRLRASGLVVPVLVLTGLSRPQAKVAAFNAGADDVMTKPFDRAELMARIKAVVRRSKGHSQPGLQVGPMLLNLDSREVSVDGLAVHLTGK
ncbi:MAG: response regulator transcription factor, partial [Janthinobacterium lividum]